MSVVIFTDGSSRGNPGPGGWGAIVASNEKVVELGGGEKNATNNRMELAAVIGALKKVDNGSSVTLYLDSSYVLRGATIWSAIWEGSGWKTKGKKEVQNIDLWKEILKVVKGKKITWKLLPGHSGIPGNVRVDEIATAFADGMKPKLFSGSPKDYKIDLNQTTATQAKRSKKGREGKAYSYVSLVDGVVKTHKTWDECKARVSGVSKARFKKALDPEDEKEIIESFRKI